MKGYRKSSGVYIELSDGTPVGDTLVQVAVRPSSQYIFADTWATNPLDPSVCWRIKAAPEVSADKDGALQDFLESAGGKVVKAIVQVGIDKGHWTLTDLRAKYRTL